MNWLKRLLRNEQLESELDRELRYHVERQVDEYVRDGMSVDLARRAARARFGGLEQVKEECRDARGTRWVADFVADLKYGARLAARDRSTTLFAIVALALGIGVNSTFFTVVNAVCFRGLPIDAVDRVLFVGARDDQGRDQGLSYPEFRDLQTRSGAFGGLAAFTSGQATLVDEQLPAERLNTAYVSAAAFDHLHERPLFGRDFRRLDDVANAAPVVILSADVWERRYGADGNIVGRPVRVNGISSTVVGVMPRGFRFPDNADLWQPLTQSPGLTAQTRADRTLAVFGRLREDATLEGARTELDRIARELARESPSSNGGLRFTAVPINERYNARVTDRVWIAFLTAGLIVLLVACANVANLLLLRATVRSHEIGVRLSLGATRVRLIRQLLAESLIIAVFGGLLGFGISLAGARLLSMALTENAPYWLRFTMDARGFALLAVVSLSSVFAFGLAPALHAARTDINDVLQETGRNSAGLRSVRWTSWFVAAEFALTIVLVAAVVLGYRGYRAAAASEIRIDTANLLTMWIALPQDRYSTPERQMAFYDQFSERLRGLGSIRAVTIANALPFSGAPRRPIDVQGAPATGRPPSMISTVTVDDQYFATLGLAMLRGRALTRRDGESGTLNVVVNERFAALYFPLGDPIGKRIRIGQQGTSAAADATVVGVAPSLRQFPQGIVAEPVVYLPLRFDPPPTIALLVRHSQTADAMAAALRTELRAQDAELPLYRVLTMDQVISESTLNGRVSNGLITAIAMIALGLAVVGLYAVTAHAVVQRRREIGVRTALGARPAGVMTMVLTGALKQLGPGLLLGVAGIFAWQRLLGDPSQQYRLTDPATLGIVIAAVVGVSAAACAVPARRAALSDPVAALRRD
jgi:predicted permease